MAKRTKELPVLAKPIGGLPAHLLPEWADPRKPEHTPMRAPAAWRCASGHTFDLTREQRQRYGKGCPQCKDAAENAATLAEQLKHAGPAGPKPRDGGEAAPAHVIGGPTVGKLIPGAPQPVYAHRVELPATSGAFLVRDLLGNQARVYAWERVTPGSGATPAATRPAHHIFVVDRSGSMYGDMDGVRTTMRKLLAVEEFRRPDLLVSLVSYASHGDVRSHVERQPVTELGANVSLDKLQAGGLTCMSGGFQKALELIQHTEDTTITLHSDGYANDRSPGEERRQILDVLLPRLLNCGPRGIGARSAVVNTVAHRASSDFAFLAQLANAGGGACVQAGDLAGLYDALTRAQRAALPGAPPRTVESNRADYLLRINEKAGRVLLWQTDMAGAQRVVAVDAGDVVYRITDTSGRRADVLDHLEIASGKHDLQGLPPTQAVPVMFGFARGLVGLGRVTLAKQVALSTGVRKMRDHARALTGAQVAEFAADLEAAAALGAEYPGHAAADVCWTRTALTPQPAPRTTLPELLAVLGRHPGAVKVHVPTLMETYQRRGLRRVPGRWTVADPENGSRFAPRIDPLPYETRSRRAGSVGGDGWCDLTSIDQNDAEATVNMTLAQPVDFLTHRYSDAPNATEKNPKVMTEIAGVSMENLRTYRSFTLVGDGEVCTKMLRVRIVDKATHDAIEAMYPDVRMSIGGSFRPDLVRDLSLDLPLTRSAAEPACPPAAAVARVLRLTVLQRLLKASLADGSATPYTPAQLAALKDHYISAHLYYSPPTVSPYGPRPEDLRAAQAAGKVDSRTRYRVTFGTAGVLGTDELYSANEYLRRMFVVMDNRQAGAPHMDKPTMVDFFSGACTPRSKTLEETRRLKTGPVDTITTPVYRAALRMKSSDNWDAMGVDGFGGLGLPATFGTGRWDNPTARKQALRVVEDALEAARGPLRDVVFAVGAGGAVPDSWGAALGADELERRLPAYSVPKGDRDASFYVVRAPALGGGTPLPVDSYGDVVVMVKAEEALYSVDKED